jgi:Dodecin
VKTASETLRDLRVAEVVEQDLHIEEEDGEIIFRTKLRLSFRYNAGHAHIHQQNGQRARLTRTSAGFRPNIARPSRAPGGPCQIVPKVPCHLPPKVTGDLGERAAPGG